MGLKAPTAGWARLSPELLTDDDWLSCGRDARLVFVTSIALAKASQRDGRISLRAMQGVQFGALDPGEVEAAAVELVDVGLWVATEKRGEFMVRSFLKWNESADEQDSRREQKRLGAHLTNHKLGYHDSKPNEACPSCQPVDNSVNATANAIASPVDNSSVQADAPASVEMPPTAESPSGNASDARAYALANAPGNASERKTRRDETRRDETETTPPSPPVDNSGELSTELEAVEVADRLIEILGYLDQSAGQDVRLYVGHALGRGWTRAQLEGCAAEAAESGADDPRRYLVGMLRKRANTDPEPVAAPTTASDVWGLPPTPEPAPTNQAALDAELAARTGYQPPPRLTIVDSP